MMHMWQSRVEIEDYSIGYFVLYRWTSVKGEGHTCFIDAWIFNESMKRVWAPPLMEVQWYGAVNAAMPLKNATK